MHDSESQSSIKAEKIMDEFKIAKYLNIAVVGTFSIASIINIILFPPIEVTSGFKIFFYICLSIFMLPYLLCIRAFSPQTQGWKGAIIVSVLWGAFIIAGAIVRPVEPERTFINLIFAAILLVSAINIFLLVIRRGKIDEQIAVRIKIEKNEAHMKIGNISKLMEREIKFHESDGYIVHSSDNNEVVMVKYRKPSVSKVILWVFLSIVCPIILIILILSPARIFYFFKGEKYTLSLREKNGKIESNILFG